MPPPTRSIAAGSCMRLAPSLRRSFYAAAGVAMLSGIAWLLPRSSASLWLEIHGGAAMVVLVLLGSTVALHAPAGWRERQNRCSGLLLSALMAVLVLTGFLLYYLGGEGARSVASVVHWGVGLAA